MKLSLLRLFSFSAYTTLILCLLFCALVTANGGHHIYPAPHPYLNTPIRTAPVILALAILWCKPKFMIFSLSLSSQNPLRNHHAKRRNSERIARSIDHHWAVWATIKRNKPASHAIKLPSPVVTPGAPGAWLVFFFFSVWCVLRIDKYLFLPIVLSLSLCLSLTHQHTQKLPATTSSK